MTIKEIKDDMLAISEDIEDLMEKLRNKFDDYERFAEKAWIFTPELMWKKKPKEDLMEKLRNKFDDYERFAEYLAEKIYDEGYNEGYDEGIKRGKET